MHDRTDSIPGNRGRDCCGIADIGFDERNAVGYSPTKACHQIVDHNDRPASIAQGKDGMAADIARATGHKDREFLVHPRHPIVKD